MKPILRHAQAWESNLKVTTPQGLDPLRGKVPRGFSRPVLEALSIPNGNNPGRMRRADLPVGPALSQAILHATTAWARTDDECKLAEERRREASNLVGASRWASPPLHTWRVMRTSLDLLGIVIWG